MNKEFKQKIIPLPDGYYAYKQYILPTNYIGASVFYYKHQMHKIDNLSDLSNKVFIDVGGCIGDSALVFTEYTDGKIYTFEASKKNYERILETIRLNNCKNITPINNALGSKKETLKLRMTRSIGANTFVSESEVLKERNEPESEYEEVQVITLDSFVEKNNIDNIGLIKVDIEGFEQEFLKGAEKTIRKYRPVLLLSIYHNAADFFDIKPMVEGWDLNYKFKISHPMDGSIFGETLLICQ